MACLRWRRPLLIHRSVNQSVSRTISTTQLRCLSLSTNQSIRPSVSQSIYQSTSLFDCSVRSRWNIHQSRSLSTQSTTSLSNDQSTTQSTIPPNDQSATKSTGQSTGKSSNQSSSKQSSNRWSKRQRLLLLGLGFLTVFGTSAAVVAVSSSDSVVNELAYDVFVTCNALVRLSRDIYTTVRMVADYLWVLHQIEGLPEAVREVKLDEAHWRNAVRLKDCFNANGGVYIKFGQHIAQAAHLLPDAYCITMMSTLDNAPIAEYDEVRASIEQSLGKPVSEVFKSLTANPVASASIAQVHFGVLHTGEEVAVKVQHRFIRHTVASDIRAVELIVQTIHKLFPTFDYNWLVAEMSTSLPKECDFRLEGANAERCRRMFASRDDVLVPKIYWEYTSDRLLVMERMHGVQVTDVKSIKNMGLRPADVSELVNEVFSSMIFEHGITHADPHAGNLFIGKHARHPSMPALILLDHGLYSEITPEFRLLYCNLWRSLIVGDRAKVKHYAELCGASGVHDIFAAMLTRRPWAEGDNVNAASLTSDDAPDRATMRKFAAEYGLDIQGVLAKLPASMILLLKTNECLRHIDTAMGTNYRSFVIMARYCQRAINEQRLHEHGGVRAHIVNMKEIVAIESRILVLECLLFVSSCIKFARTMVFGLWKTSDYRALMRRVKLPRSGRRSPALK